MNILAIDPGASGGMAWTFDGIIEASKLPETLTDLKERLISLKAQSPDWTCYMEDVPNSVFGRSSMKSMPKLHRNAGRIEGLLCGLSFRVIMVRPQKWQPIFSLGKRSQCASDTIWKNKLKSEAQRRFPNQEVTHAIADALLILDYAISTEKV